MGKEGLLLLLLLLGVRACRVRRNTLNDRVAVHCYLKHSDMKMDACIYCCNKPPNLMCWQAVHKEHESCVPSN